MAQDRARDNGDLPGRVAAVAGPLADELGVELVDVEIKGASGSRVVRLIADTPTADPDDGLDIDVIARLSRAVAAALDEDDFIPGRYTLEVSSPGADRALRTARDFARNQGREVRVVHDAPDERTEITGTVVASDESAVTIEVAGEHVAVPIDEIDHGKVILPW